MKKTDDNELNIDIEVIKRVLKKDPEKRNAKDITILSNAIQNIPFFKKYHSEGYTDVHIKCAKYMKYEFINQAEAVFHIDTVGDKFYLTLQGKIGIYIRLPFLQKKKEDTENLQDQKLNLTCVKELSAGFGFGELALINNKPRLASIFCHEDSHFMTLDKASFVLILKKREEQKLNDQITYLSKLPFFEGWNKYLIKMIYLNSYRMKFVKNEKVFSEGEEPNNVYIVTEGEFVVQKSFNKINNEDQFVFNESDQNNLLKRDGSKKTKQIKMLVLVVNEMFGEEDIMNKQSARQYTAICSSLSGECIVIKKRDFEMRIMEEVTSQQFLKDRMNYKNEYWSNKIIKIRKSIAGFQSYIYDERDQIQENHKISQFISKIEQSNNSPTHNQKSLKDEKGNGRMSFLSNKDNQQKQIIRSSFTNNFPPSHALKKIENDTEFEKNNQSNHQRSSQYFDISKSSQQISQAKSLVTIAFSTSQNEFQRNSNQKEDKQVSKNFFKGACQSDTQLPLLLQQERNNNNASMNSSQKQNNEMIPTPKMSQRNQLQSILSLSNNKIDDLDAKTNKITSVKDNIFNIEFPSSRKQIGKQSSLYTQFEGQYKHQTNITSLNSQQFEDDIDLHEYEGENLKRNNSLLKQQSKYQTDEDNNVTKVKFLQNESKIYTSINLSKDIQSFQNLKSPTSQKTIKVTAEANNDSFESYNFVSQRIKQAQDEQEKLKYISDIYRISMKPQSSNKSLPSEIKQVEAEKEEEEEEKEGEQSREKDQNLFMNRYFKFYNNKSLKSTENGDQSKIPILKSFLRASNQILHSKNLSPREKYKHQQKKQSLFLQSSFSPMKGNSQDQPLYKFEEYKFHANQNKKSKGEQQDKHEIDQNIYILGKQNISIERELYLSQDQGKNEEEQQSQVNNTSTLESQKKKKKKNKSLFINQLFQDKLKRRSPIHSFLNSEEIYGNNKNSCKQIGNNLSLSSSSFSNRNRIFQSFGNNSSKNNKQHSQQHLDLTHSISTTHLSSLSSLTNTISTPSQQIVSNSPYFNQVKKRNPAPQKKQFKESNNFKENLMQQLCFNPEEKLF